MHHLTKQAFYKVLNYDTFEKSQSVFYSPLSVSRNFQVIQIKLQLRINLTCFYSGDLGFFKTWRFSPPGIREFLKSGDFYPGYQGFLSPEIGDFYPRNFLGRRIFGGGALFSQDRDIPPKSHLWLYLPDVENQLLIQPLVNIDQLLKQVISYDLVVNKGHIHN